VIHARVRRRVRLLRWQSVWELRKLVIATVVVRVQLIEDEAAVSPAKRELCARHRASRRWVEPRSTRASHDDDDER
jgi:uncharacterized protein (UPF0276 family)